MVMESNGIPTGWPLGLGNMGSRIIVAETAVAPPPTRTYPTRTVRHASFSSFSSSNLDTESSASFFPDHSVSLGRLIGIRPPNNIGRGSLCSEHRKMTDERSLHLGVAESHEKAQGLCAPLLHHVIRKKGRNGNSSRH